MSAFVFSQDTPQPVEIQPVNKPRITLFTETSRPADKIRKEFPFDIALRNAAGDTLNSASVFPQNGKPTVLAFWLTTCVPCRHELAAITQKFEGWKLEKDFNFYAISVDYPKNYEAFQRRVNESGWAFPAYYDLNREFRVILPGELNGLPQTFVLDGKGNIVHQKKKYVPGDEDKLFELIKTL